MNLNQTIFANTLLLMLVGGALVAPVDVAIGDGHLKLEPEFTDDGKMVRPSGWREWIFVGSPLTPNGLNNGEAAFPEFHNVYIDPVSWAHWKKTGKFREGTMIAKELTLVGETSATSGQGFFNGDLQGFEISYKNSKRYEDQPGGWVYFTFGHQPEPYEDTAAPQPFAACAACHSAAAADDMVFTQYYPILQEAKSAGDKGAGTGGRK